MFGSEPRGVELVIQSGLPEAWQGQGKVLFKLVDVAVRTILQALHSSAWSVRTTFKASNVFLFKHSFNIWCTSTLDWIFTLALGPLFFLGILGSSKYFRMPSMAWSRFWNAQVATCLRSWDFRFQWYKRGNGCTVDITFYFLKVQCLAPILVEQIPRSLFNLFLAARCKNQKPPHCNLLTANNALDRRNSKSQMQLKNHNFLQFPTMHPQYWIYDIALSHLTSALFIFQVSVGALSGWTKRLSFFLAAAKVSWSPDSSRGTTGSFNISASSCNKHQTAATQLLHAYFPPYHHFKVPMTLLVINVTQQWLNIRKE